MTPDRFLAEAYRADPESQIIKIDYTQADNGKIEMWIKPRGQVRQRYVFHPGRLRAWIKFIKLNKKGAIQWTDH